MPALSLVRSFGVIWLVLLGAMATFGGTTGRSIALAGLVALVIDTATFRAMMGDFIAFSGRGSAVLEGTALAQQALLLIRAHRRQIRFSARPISSFLALI